MITLGEFELDDSIQRGMFILAKGFLIGTAMFPIAKAFRQSCSGVVTVVTTTNMGSDCGSDAHFVLVYHYFLTLVAASSLVVIVVIVVTCTAAGRRFTWTCSKICLHLGQRELSARGTTCT